MHTWRSMLPRQEVRDILANDETAKALKPGESSHFYYDHWASLIPIYTLFDGERFTQIMGARDALGNRTVCSRARGDLGSEWITYDSSGQAISAGSYGFLGLPTAVYSYVAPADSYGNFTLSPSTLAQFKGDPNRATSMLYNEKFSISILGVLGYGRINKKNYLQLVWIPFPAPF